MRRFRLFCKPCQIASSTSVGGADLERLFKYTHPAVALAMAAFKHGPAADLFATDALLETQLDDNWEGDTDALGRFLCTHVHHTLRVRDDDGHLYDDEGGAL